MHELTNIEFLKKLPCLILIIDYRASQKSAHLRIFLNPGLGAKIHDKLTTWFAYISQNRETIETRAIWKVRHQGPQNSKTIFQPDMKESRVCLWKFLFWSFLHIKIIKPDQALSSHVHGQIWPNSNFVKSFWVPDGFCQ